MSKRSEYRRWAGKPLDVSEKQLPDVKLARLLAKAEKDISAGYVRSARSFLREFKNAHKSPTM